MPASIWLQVADAQEYVIRSTIEYRDDFCMAWHDMEDREYLNSLCQSCGYIHIDPERPDDEADPWIDLALGTLMAQVRRLTVLHGQRQGCNIHRPAQHARVLAWSAQHQPAAHRYVDIRHAGRQLAV